MAAFAMTYDFANEPAQTPRGDFELLPAGWYLAQAISNEEKGIKNGGTRHEFVFEILDGPHASRKLWVSLNLGSLNEESVRYARSDLDAMCAAVGKRQVANGDELMFQPMMIRVVVKPPKERVKVPPEALLMTMRCCWFWSWWMGLELSFQCLC